MRRLMSVSEIESCSSMRRYKASSIKMGSIFAAVILGKEGVGEVGMQMRQEYSKKGIWGYVLSISTAHFALTFL